jgi:hypothetical protein
LFGHARFDSAFRVSRFRSSGRRFMKSIDQA